MKAIALCSGGMDSVVALHHACNHDAVEVIGVASFNYGSKHNAKEIPFARHHADRFGLPHFVIDVPFINEHFASSLLQSGTPIPEGHYEDEVMKQTVVPFRNGIMLSIAAGLAESKGANGVIIGAHSGDHAIYPDCRADFMQAMRAAIGLGTYAHVQLAAPLQTLTKADVVRIGRDLGVDFAQTWSCYKGGEVHCGVCGTCIERREAFYLAGVEDPTVYDDAAPSIEVLAANNFKLPRAFESISDEEDDEDDVRADDHDPNG